MTSRAARQMSINKRLANAGEERAIAKLRSLGVLMPQEIATPFIITKRGKGNWFQGYYKEKVVGDITGHTVNGVAVLAEVKTIWDRNLRWSDFKPHQPPFLSQHAENAISLLVWIHHSGIYVCNWLDVLSSGFKRGKSLKIETAQKIYLDRVE